MRCTLCNADSDYIAYHDSEWGKPLHDDGALFELPLLEGMQAGLANDHEKQCCLCGKDVNADI